jgi:CBS domain-containing protein
VSAYREMLRSDPDRGPLYHAYQIMQRQIVSVTSTDAVERAWRILLERRIHQAPVLDPTYRLVGIVSERDLLTVLNVEEGRVRDVLTKRVSDVMTHAGRHAPTRSPTSDGLRWVMLEHPCRLRIYHNNALLEEPRRLPVDRREGRRCRDRRLPGDATEPRRTARRCCASSA